MFYKVHTQNHIRFNFTSSNGYILLSVHFLYTKVTFNSVIILTGLLKQQFELFSKFCCTAVWRKCCENTPKCSVLLLDCVDQELNGYISLHSVFSLKQPGPYLSIWLATHNFHSVPLLLRCALLQLGWPKETHPVQVGAVTALRGGHEGRHNQKNLKERKIDIKE